MKYSPAPRRLCDPPIPVTVDLGRAFARTPRSARLGLALRVKAEALHLSDSVPGLLHAWVRTTAGDWIALCEMDLRTGNGNGAMRVRQWCPSGSITPRDVQPR